MEYIAFACHKRCSYAVVGDRGGHLLIGGPDPHEFGALVAVETVGDWYWIVVEIEQVGFQAPPGPRRQGQAYAGDGEQDEQARRSRTEAAPAGRDLTLGGIPRRRSGMHGSFPGRGFGPAEDGVSNRNGPRVWEQGSGALS